MDSTVRRIVNKGLSDITKNVKKLSKAYKVDRVPMKLVYMVIDEAKVNHTTERKANEFITKYNDTLKSIKSILKSCSDNIGDEKITVKEVSLVIDHVKKSFNAQ